MQTKIIPYLITKSNRKYNPLAALLLLSSGYSFFQKEESNIFSYTSSIIQKNIYWFTLKSFYPIILTEYSTLNSMKREKVVHDSDDSESDVEDFHTPSLDSDTENEFIDDDSGFLVETDSEEEIITSDDNTDSDT